MATPSHPAHLLYQQSPVAYFHIVTFRLSKYGTQYMQHMATITLAVTGAPARRSYRPAVQYKAMPPKAVSSDSLPAMEQVHRLQSLPSAFSELQMSDRCVHLQVLFVECGVGCDQHGQNMTVS